MVEVVCSEQPEGSRRTRPSAFRAGRSDPPAFRILLSGSSVSILGSQISTIAWPLLMLHLDNSPFIAGLVTCATIVPSMLAYMPAGVLTDRWNPWRVMLSAEVLRGISIATVVVLLMTLYGRVNIYLLIEFMVAEEILEIFWQLASRRYMSQLMTSDEMASGQARIELMTHTAVLAGRAIGPFLFAITLYLPFGADAVSFVFSVWVLLMLGHQRRRPRELPGRASGKLRTEVREGFRWLARHRRVTATQLVMAFTTLIAQALIMMFLAEAHDHRLSAVATGAVLAASGAGGMIGSLVARRLPDWIRKSWLSIQLCAWSVALCVLALSGVRFAWCIAVVMLVLGLTGSIGNIEFRTFLVRTLRGSGEECLLSRITSIGQVLAIGALGLGPLLGGGAIQKFGIQVAVWIFFFLVLSVTMSLFVVSRLSWLSAEQGAGRPGLPQNDHPAAMASSGSDAARSAQGRQRSRP